MNIRKVKVSGVNLEIIDIPPTFYRVQNVESFAIGVGLDEPDGEPQAVCVDLNGTHYSFSFESFRAFRTIVEQFVELEPSLAEKLKPE